MTLHDRPPHPDDIPPHDYDPDQADAWDAFQAELDALHHADLLRLGLIPNVEDPHWTPPDDDPDAPTPTESPDLDDILDTDEPDHDWLVEGLLEHGDRLIVTGLEGKGKSTLLRQMGVQFASGVHPFTLADIPPVTTLLVDAENSRRQTRRHLGPLRDAAADRYPHGGMRLEFRPDGLDLTRTPDRDWLHDRLTVNRPDLVIIGPSYKLATGDPKDEQTARSVALFLDVLRAEYGITLIIEAHIPYSEGPKSARPMRPYGASLWSRWPEFGVYLAPDGTLTHWRGAREERAWPSRLERGQPWPWMVPVGAETGEPWDGPTHATDAVCDVLAAVYPAQLTRNALAREVRMAGHTFRTTTIDAALVRAVTDGRINTRLGPRNSRLYTAARPAEPDDHHDEDF
jgi:hypothetical protein